MTFHMSGRTILITQCFHSSLKFYNLSYGMTYYKFMKFAKLLTDNVKITSQ